MVSARLDGLPPNRVLLKSLKPVACWQHWYAAFVYVPGGQAGPETGPLPKVYNMFKSARIWWIKVWNQVQVQFRSWNQLKLTKCESHAHAHWILFKSAQIWWLRVWIWNQSFRCIVCSIPQIWITFPNGVSNLISDKFWHLSELSGGFYISPTWWRRDHYSPVFVER